MCISPLALNPAQVNETPGSQVARQPPAQHPAAASGSRAAGVAGLSVLAASGPSGSAIFRTHAARRSFAIPGCRWMERRYAHPGANAQSFEDVGGGPPGHRSAPTARRQQADAAIAVKRGICASSLGPAGSHGGASLRRIACSAIWPVHRPYQQDADEQFWQCHVAA